MAEAKDECKTGQSSAELSGEQLSKVAGGDKGGGKEKDWNACCPKCNGSLRTRYETVNSVRVLRYYCYNAYCSMYNRSLSDSEVSWQKVD